MRLIVTPPHICSITTYLISADPELLSDHFELPSKALGTLKCRRPLKCITLAVRELSGYEGRQAIPSLIMLRLDAGNNPRELNEDLFVVEP